MKKLITLFDSNFGGTILNPFLEFTKERSGDIEIFTDSHLHEVRNSSAKINIAWLVEPQCINPPIYQFASTWSFDYVLTHDKNYVKNLGNRGIYIPFGTAWLPESDEPKTKLISQILSCKQWTAFQRLRHHIAAQCKGIDNYGVEYDNNLEGSKAPALTPYYFSVIIENDRVPGFFTEKLLDCLLSRTIPVYCGDPDIGDKFNDTGIIQFNTLKEFEKILPTLTPEMYESKQLAIEENIINAHKYENWGVNLYNAIKELL